MPQIEDTLGELVAAGLVTCDGFGALRSLIAGAKRKHRLRRRGSRGAPPLESGRWSLLRGPDIPSVDPAERAEQWCRLLLRRYGVFFRDLVARESAAPSWRDLVRAFRRLEARGDFRGGRFVGGVAGEQYALPEVVPALRQTDTAPGDDLLLLAATDPLNLWGRITPGPKIPAAPGCRLVLHKGQLVAYRVGADVHLEAGPADLDGRVAVERLLRLGRRAADPLASGG